MNRYYRWRFIATMWAPFVWETWRWANSRFDAWFIAQLKKSWQLPRRQL